MEDQSYFADMPINMDSIIIDSPQLTNGTFEYEDESYFFQTYVPLSSFPTPPPSDKASDGGTRPHSSASCEDFHEEDCPLLGPSIHLSNLMPTAASLLDPSPSLILSILKRAKLPKETLALAVCILDSLNSRFANIWRRSFPLSRPSSYQNTSYTFSAPQKIPHIDTIRPEIIILSALILAQKFLDDEQSPTSFWAENIGQYRWNTDQINATEFAIMENLQWRILPLWNEDRLAEAMEDMEMAGTQGQAMKFRQAQARNSLNIGLRESAVAGNRDTDTSSKMVPGRLDTKMGQAMQCDLTKLWTPMEQPSSLNNRGSSTDLRSLSMETRRAFGAPTDEFMSPRSYGRVVEPFPLYTEPILGGD